MSGPITEGIGLLVSGDYRHTDGQFEIEAPTESDGEFVDRYEACNVNARLLAEPTDALTLDAKARYGEVNAGSIVFNAAFALPNFAAIDPLFHENVNERDSWLADRGALDAGAGAAVSRRPAHRGAG